MNLFKKLLLAVGLVLFAQTAFAQNSDCQKFHAGKFKLNDMPGIVVERDSLYQIERDPKTGHYAKYKITWIDDCTYVLKLIKTNDKTQRKGNRQIGDLQVKIIAVEGDVYTYSATSLKRKELPPIKGKMTKIK
ncbi:MAG: hypothetical protein ACRCYO_08135 [Bacteroidia bacterium]